MTSILTDRRDGLSSATAMKGPCRAATTADITLAGEQTIDGIAVASGDRVLVKNQLRSYENGIYTVDTGDWSRCKDFSRNDDVVKGTRVVVTDGTQASSYQVSFAGTLSLGTTEISFSNAPGFDLAGAPLATSGVSSLLGVDGSGDIVRANSMVTSSVDMWVADYLRNTNHEILLDRYLTDPDDTAANTVGLQEMIDDLHSSFVSTGRGGIIRLPPFLQYKLEASHLTETYYNGDTSQLANTGCLTLRAGVSLIGPGRFSGGGLHCSDRSLTVIHILEPNQVVLQGLEISNEWTAGLSGAGHGCLTLKTAAGIDTGGITQRLIYDDLFIHNVASYGLSLQNGMPQGCTISNIDVYYCGADGLDLKARYQTIEAYMNKAFNIRVRNHGVRVTGSQGIDIRGSWHVDGVDVSEFGALNDAMTYGGLRFRTKSDPALGEPDGSRSTITNFRIDCTYANPGVICNGVEIGGDDCGIAHGSIQGGQYGIAWTGNVNGVSHRTTVTDVHAKDCTTYGFFIGAGNDRTTLVGCSSDSCGTAGIRNEGDYTTIVGHMSSNETAKSSSTTGLATEAVAGAIGGYGFNPGSPAAGRASLTAIGPDTNLDFELSPKGTGIFRFNQSGSGGAATTPANFTADKFWQVRLNGAVVYIPCRSSAW